MKVTLELNNFDTLVWMIDGNHYVHYDCKNHTGIMLLLGDSKWEVLIIFLQTEIQCKKLN